jgi:hypothetical protein
MNRYRLYWYDDTSLRMPEYVEADKYVFKNIDCIQVGDQDNRVIEFYKGDDVKLTLIGWPKAIELEAPVSQ